MVQRTKRAPHLGKIEEMQRELKDFEPLLVSRRPFRLGYAAMAGSLSIA